MEKNNKNTITPKQAATLIVATQIGIGMQVLPSAAAEKAGHDGWISILIIGGVVLVAIHIVLMLSKRFNFQSILDISISVCGKFIAFIINILLLLSLLYIAIANYSLFVAGVGVWFFRATPTWILAVYLIIPSVYLTFKGLKCISRFTFLLYIIIPLIFLLIILNLQDFRLTALFPVGEKGFPDIIKAIPSTIFVFTGFEILLFITPSIKNDKTLSRKISASIIISTLLYVLVVIATLGVFGEDLVIKRFNALLGLARLIKLPVVERIDLYFLAVWISGLCLVINTYLFLVCDTAQRIFKYKARFIPVMIITFLIIITVSFIEDNILVLKLINLMGYVSCFAGFLIPSSLLITAVLRKKKGG